MAKRTTKPPPPFSTTAILWPSSCLQQYVVWRLISVSGSQVSQISRCVFPTILLMFVLLLYFKREYICVISLSSRMYSDFFERPVRWPPDIVQLCMCWPNDAHTLTSADMCCVIILLFSSIKIYIREIRLGKWVAKPSRHISIILVSVGSQLLLLWKVSK